MSSIKKSLLSCTFLLISAHAHAQWSIGIDGGIDQCLRNTVKSYDYKNLLVPHIGYDIGINATYLFPCKIGIRIGADLESRNYNPLYASCATPNKRGNARIVKNQYIVVPVLGILEHKFNWFNCYLGAGGYVGYWASKHWEDFSSQQYGFTQADNRYDAGASAVIGIGMSFKRGWGLRCEGFVNQSLANNHNTGSKYFRQYSYDTVYGAKLGFTYSFH